ncbi:MAG: efflux RND transporter periplasmic adaptor subunit [Limisphaerales bacterium]
MKFKKILQCSFLLVAAAATIALISCAKKGNASKAENDVAYYTCSMHPSVKSQDPKAKCPICGMGLVPVEKKKNGDAPAGKNEAKSMSMSPEEHAKMKSSKDGMKEMQMPGMPGMKKENATEQPGEFTVPVTRQQQIGVTYATVEKKSLEQNIRVTGTVAYDKQRHWDFVSRVEGYVQNLQISSRGELVEKNQPLMNLYSPELLTTQQEFLNLLKMRDDAQKNNSTAAVDSANRLLESARRRLQLWNITTNQIAKLEEKREAQENLTLYSPFKGVVQDLRVDQGRRVMVGDHLMDIADLSVVWIWAEFYQDELPLLKKNLPVTITSSSYPNEKFVGKIIVMDPFINEATRTGRVRIDVENPDLKLRPEMFVNVDLKIEAGQHLAIPLNAVMPTGERNIVFVDKGEGKLEPRFVEIGKKLGTNYVVKSGVKEGERVVSSANFLIDAEAKVQGALKSW